MLVAIVNGIQCEINKSQTELFWENEWIEIQQDQDGDFFIHPADQKAIPVKIRMIKKDQLHISTVSKSGRRSNPSEFGSVYITVSKGKGQPYNQIAVEVSQSGSDKSKYDRFDALIYVQFEERNVWSGTFADLRKRLTDEA